MAGGCSTFLPDFFHACFEQSFVETTNFSIPEVDLQGGSGEFTAMTSLAGDPLVSRKSTSSGALQEVVETHKSKRLKFSVVEDGSASGGYSDKAPHVTVERNRRKQMNEHLSVLRSLMPCFYAKKGDQASIIGGVVDYIKELQQVLQTLEAKKQRKVYSELVMSPRLVSSPRKPSLSPKPSLPISPRTPQPATPYGPINITHPFILAPSSPANSFTNSDNNSSDHQLVANLRSAIAEVEVKFVGGNLLLKTYCSNRIQGQTTKVIAVLENLSLEVLQAKISVVDEALVNSFTIKIGVECQLSAEELAQHIQQTFCS